MKTMFTARWWWLSTALSLGTVAISWYQLEALGFGSFCRGLQHHARGQFHEAVESYRIAAERGHVSSQFNLGMMYSAGEGVERDAAESVKWFRMAADQGNGAARVNLAVAYACGEGVPKDLKEAVAQFRRAFERIGDSAWYCLRVSRRSLEEVPVEFQRAIEPYKPRRQANAVSEERGPLLRAGAKNVSSSVRMWPCATGDAGMTYWNIEAGGTGTLATLDHHTRAYSGRAVLIGASTRGDAWKLASFVAEIALVGLLLFGVCDFAVTLFDRIRERRLTNRAPRTPTSP
jgi:hypothetical protein